MGTAGTFGLMPYALEMYLKDNPNIIVKGFWPVHATPPEEVIAASQVMPTYFVFYQDCVDCPKWQFSVSQTFNNKKFPGIRFPNDISTLSHIWYTSNSIT